MRYIRLYEKNKEEIHSNQYPWDYLDSYNHIEILELLVKELSKPYHTEINMLWVKELLKQTNPNIISKKTKYSPLTMACKNNHIDVIKELLKISNIDVNIKDRNRKIPIIIASENGNIDIVKELLKNPNIDINITNHNGWTALIMASSGGYTDIVSELMKQPEINPNIQEYEAGLSAIMCAIYFKKIETLRELLSYPNVDTSLINLVGKTAWKMSSKEIREQFPQLNPQK